MLTKSNGKKIKLGIFVSRNRHLSCSLKRLTENVLKSIQPNFKSKVFLPDLFSGRKALQKAFKDFCSTVDIILLLPCRYSDLIFNERVPVVFFALGEIALPYHHLFSFWNLLFPSNSVLFSSRADIEIFSKTFPGHKDMAYFTPLPVDLNVFKPLSIETNYGTRLRLGIGREDPLLLYIGRISQHKNVHLLLKLFKEVTVRFNDSKLFIVGDAPGISYNDSAMSDQAYHNLVKRLIKEYGLTKKVIMLPFQDTDELVRLYSAADLFINLTTSPDENFGYAQVEAMACATPVICSAWGGLKDTVLDGKTGFLIPTMVTENGAGVDWKMGAQRVIELLKNDRLKSTFSRAALMHAREHFSFEEFSLRIESVFLDTLRRKADKPKTASRTIFTHSRKKIMDFYLECLYKDALRRQPGNKNNLPYYSGNNHSIFEFFARPYSAKKIRRTGFLSFR